jgi:hypothetical protein
MAVMLPPPTSGWLMPSVDRDALLGLLLAHRALGSK